MQKKLRGKIKSLTTEEFKHLIINSINYTDVLRRLGLRTAGGNYKTLKNRIIKENLDVSHYKETRWNDVKQRVFTPRIPLIEILVKNSTYTNTVTLKNRLIKEGLLKEACYKCGGLNIWEGKRLALHLDHINGINSDNRLINLRLLCPNCHSQTLTYTGRNLEFKLALKYCQDESCNNILNKQNVSGYCFTCFNKYKSYNATAYKGVVCNSHDCNNLVSKSKTGLCLSCYPKTRRIVTRPTKEELLDLIISKPFTAIAKQFGVSDNAIRKWCKNYDLPYKKQDINNLFQ